ncbi:MAG TPA: endonuclease III [Candidatus Acidoferrales bacterium]|nr:endonuclease III [Candidatus Acidoferrales bacterium]
MSKISYLESTSFKIAFVPSIFYVLYMKRKPKTKSVSKARSKPKPKRIIHKKKVSSVRVVRDWAKAMNPIFENYGQRKHPLDYRNKYQLMVMVVLSARDSDRHINSIAPALFEKYPSMRELSKLEPEDLYPYINTVTNFPNKAKWITSIAKAVGDDESIPSTLDELTKLPGIGRKSANVIISESGGIAEGVIVDLHVLRVAPRIGIAKGTNPEKIEKQIMEKVPQEYWRAAGMGMSFLGREICRPKNPKCEECVVNKVCEYYAALK